MQPDRHLSYFILRLPPCKEQTQQSGRSLADWKPFVDYRPKGKIDPQSLKSCPSPLGHEGRSTVIAACMTLTSPLSPLCHTPPFRKAEEESPSLLTRHTANLIKSQIHNTLFKIQMFFTETSRRKGVERNGPTKVIRIHLQGLVPDYSKLIISALCSRRTPRDHIISILHIHYATNGNTIIKQHWYSGKDKTSVPSSRAHESIQHFSTHAVETGGKLQADSFHIKP